MNSIAFTSCIFSVLPTWAPGTKPLPSNSHTLPSSRHSLYLYLLQSTPTSVVQYPEFIIVLNKTLRYRMELELKTSNSADALIERAERRGLTGDRSKISPHTVHRNLRPKSKNQYSQALKV